MSDVIATDAIPATGFTKEFAVAASIHGLSFV
jgi:hypothetical protein